MIRTEPIGLRTIRFGCLDPGPWTWTLDQDPDPGPDPDPDPGPWTLDLEPGKRGKSGEKKNGKRGKKSLCRYTLWYMVAHEIPDFRE